MSQRMRIIQYGIRPTDASIARLLEARPGLRTSMDQSIMNMNKVYEVPFVEGKIQIRGESAVFIGDKRGI